MEANIEMGDLLKNLKTLPEKVQKRILVGGVRAAAKPIIIEARSLVPKNNGTLKKSIGVVKVKTRKKSLVWFTVSPRVDGSNDGWYAHFLEFGTYSKREKPLSSKTKYSAKRAKRRNSVIAKGGGIAAHPFMRPAFEKEGKNTIKYLKNYIAKRLDKELER